MDNEDERIIREQEKMRRNKITKEKKVQREIKQKVTEKNENIEKEAGGADDDDGEAKDDD